VSEAEPEVQAGAEAEPVPESEPGVQAGAGAEAEPVPGPEVQAGAGALREPESERSPVMQAASEAVRGVIRKPYRT